MVVADLRSYRLLRTWLMTFLANEACGLAGTLDDDFPSRGGRAKRFPRTRGCGGEQYYLHVVLIV